MPTKTKKDRPLVDTELIRQRLKLKSLQAKTDLFTRHPKAAQKFLKKNVDIARLREHSAKIIGAGAIAGALFLAPPASERLLTATNSAVVRSVDEGSIYKDKREELKSLAKGILPTRVAALNREQEKGLEQVFKETLGVNSKATLEGEHLNTTYGYIGLEQHLRRYPGDTLANHNDGDTSVLKEGMAPGLGAWGYFAPSKSAFTDSLEEAEKWYAGVQTLYLPEWNTRQPYLRDWYKYRKVLIVNPENGQAVIAAIADSGPAAWTGKHFGGSPEVMKELGGEKGIRYTKGNVVLFFVDDPENEMALGPVNY